MATMILWPRLSIFCLIVGFGKCDLYQFVQLPVLFRVLNSGYQSRISASSATQCASLINSQTIAVQFNPTKQQCTSVAFGQIYGFNAQDTGTVWYLRMSGQGGQCVSSCEAKIALISYVYGNQLCPGTIFTYNPTYGYCVGNMNQQAKQNTSRTYWTNYASYTQGGYTDYTLLVMTRRQATEALTKTCPYTTSSLITFNGQWYCYSPINTNNPPIQYISNNQCGRWISGATPVKFIHSAEPGYMSLRFGQKTFIGMYLPSGVPPSTTAYKYSDGTTVPATYQNWAKTPTGNQAVIIQPDFKLYDVAPSTMTQLVCRSPAT